MTFSRLGKHHVLTRETITKRVNYVSADFITTRSRSGPDCDAHILRTGFVFVSHSAQGFRGNFSQSAAPPGMHRGE